MRSSRAEKSKAMPDVTRLRGSGAAASQEAQASREFAAAAWSAECASCVCCALGPLARVCNALPAAHLMNASGCSGAAAALGPSLAAAAALVAGGPPPPLRAMRLSFMRSWNSRPCHKPGHGMGRAHSLNQMAPTTSGTADAHASEPPARMPRPLPCSIPELATHPTPCLLPGPLSPAPAPPWRWTTE
jgi:hypothetical protein